MALAENVYAVILAGGSGTRFWPKSRQKSPKQLCSIGSESETMLEITLKRLDGFIPPERRMIVTHVDQIEGTRAVAGELCQHYLAEPEARNTANALALASLEIEKLHTGTDQPIMVSLHADHVIKNVHAFRTAIEKGIEVAGQGYLTLLGITPEGPETGYGYIEMGESLGTGSKVSSFREKPEFAIAKEYVDSGKFLWNAGIFVWSIPKILAELGEHLPNAIKHLSELLTEDSRSFTNISSDILAETYSKLPKISIDHAILEVSTDVAVVEADIGWQDVGSWDALAKCFPTDSNGNVFYGDCLALDCEGTTIDTDSDFVACIGLKDLVVVKSKGAVLVCPTSRAQEVKKVVEHLKSGKRSELI